VRETEGASSKFFAGARSAYRTACLAGEACARPLCQHPAVAPRRGSRVRGEGLFPLLGRFPPVTSDTDATPLFPPLLPSPPLPSPSLFLFRSQTANEWWPCLVDS